MVPESRALALDRAPVGGEVSFDGWWDVVPRALIH